MTLALFALGLFQCCLIWMLGRCGLELRLRGRLQQEQAFSTPPPGGWPQCAVIVPVAGCHPDMEAALRSLAEQDYPDYLLLLVTAGREDPALSLIDRLAAEYENIVHVTAGQASGHGQKNHNLLAGIAQTPGSTAIYAFCDSTHIARPDFLRCLTAPIARGETAFTTGYHEVEPRDQGITGLAYAISVLFMRFMQGIPSLAQPWGGAMAMSREAYERYDIEALWQDNVVDDCSLAALLARSGAHVRLCPGAILDTRASRRFSDWRAWMERQILFLKFCMPGQWLGLGIVCAIMIIPPVWCAYACMRGIFGLGGGMAPFLALCWFCALWYAIGGWRAFLARTPDISRWLWAFFYACSMFGIVYLGTLFKRTLLWHNILYRVGPGGRVLSMKRL